MLTAGRGLTGLGLKPAEPTSLGLTEGEVEVVVRVERPKSGKGGMLGVTNSSTSFFLLSARHPSESVSSALYWEAVNELSLWEGDLVSPNTSLSLGVVARPTLAQVEAICCLWVVTRSAIISEMFLRGLDEPAVRGEAGGVPPRGGVRGLCERGLCEPLAGVEGDEWVLFSLVLQRRYNTLFSLRKRENWLRQRQPERLDQELLVTRTWESSFWTLTY